jgi:hypothetical protein
VVAQDRSIDVFGSISGAVRPHERPGLQRPAARWVPGEDIALEAGKEREWEMGTVSLEQVLAEVKMLSQEEQQQLRDTLDRWLRHDRPEDRLEDVLAEAGLLRARRPRGGDTTPPTAFTPVAVRGQPVSETLLEERR